MTRFRFVSTLPWNSVAAVAAQVGGRGSASDRRTRVCLIGGGYEVIWVRHARMGDGSSRFRESQHCESMEREGVGGRGERGGKGRTCMEELGCGMHVRGIL